MWERIALVWNGLLDVVYPPCCLVCGERLDAGVLCLACQREIAPISPPFCDRCGVPVAAEESVCRLCAEGPEPPFAWSQTLGAYQGTLRRAIHRLKYDGKAALAEPLGRLLAESLDKTPTPLLTAAHPAFDVVVPVPLHPARLRQRGFNQAERIGRVLARERGWRLDADGLRRTRYTRSQTNLSPTERAANVKGAFVAREPHRFAGQSVLLVDDVLTTTATMRECAHISREAGASRICLVALAQGG
ncbi:MAG TPA: ComF family protein [Chthonomonadaceae bacterium]|nr:ComF family protein [Chthonomonadaceae bacterium]